jgi:hypothetical protein
MKIALDAQTILHSRVYIVSNDISIIHLDITRSLGTSTQRVPLGTKSQEVDESSSANRDSFIAQPAFRLGGVNLGPVN